MKELERFNFLFGFLFGILGDDLGLWVGAQSGMCDAGYQTVSKISKPPLLYSEIRVQN